MDTLEKDKILWWDSLDKNWQEAIIHATEFDFEIKSTKKRLIKFEQKKLVYDKIKNTKQITAQSPSIYSIHKSLFQFEDIEHLSLSGSPYFKSLKGIDNFKSLKYVSLNGCWDLERFDQLSELKSLEILDVSSTNVTDPLINYDEFYNNNYPFHEIEGQLLYFEVLQNLKEFHAACTNISNLWIQEFKKVHPNCKVTHWQKKDPQDSFEPNEITFRNSDAFDTPQQYNDFLNDG